MKVDKKILKKMNKKYTKNFFDKFTEKEKYIFNSYRQKIKYKKKYDYFCITELGKNKSIFKFNNLLEWDKENYVFQKENQTEVRDNYDCLYMSGDWFRALELNDFGKRNLVYGIIISVNSYLTEIVYDKLADYIDKKYPSIICRPYGVPLFENIPNSKYSKMNDSETRANGKEKELEKLKLKLRGFWREIENQVLLEVKSLEGCTFRKVTEGSIYDKSDYFIFGGIEAAKNTNPKTFFKDFYDKLQPIEILDQIANKVYSKFKKNLR